MFFVDTIVVKVRDGGQGRNTLFYVVMGVTTNGERDILGSGLVTGRKAPGSGCRVFTELKNRGVEDVFIAVCDGLKGLSEAMTITWGAGGRVAVDRAPDPQLVLLRRAAAS
ncbi:transposase [Actinomyces sp. B33]|uniref:transposase n=1 Tax=Actinomyces sp. B33 TaxID=2942131 RepID=UPI0023425D37|nr:transposase [Actinomyces sp. B33]MDC4232801.1 transposase [Actinomyces sp. B33]